MAFPASRFAPAASPLPLRVPPQLTGAGPRQPEQQELSCDPPAAVPDGREAPPVAMEADRVTVQRRVSSRGGIMVATRKIQAGLIHAGKIVTVTADEHSFRLAVDGQAAGVVPRTTTREIHRYKAYAAHPRPGRR